VTFPNQDCSWNAGLYPDCSGNPAVRQIPVGIPGGELSTGPMIKIGFSQLGGESLVKARDK